MGAVVPVLEDQAEGRLAGGLRRVVTVSVAQLPVMILGDVSKSYNMIVGTKQSNGCFR